MSLIDDGICKRVRGNCFKIFIDNFNGIHVVLSIQNAVHIAGDCITQNFELFHRYGLMSVVEENLKCHRCLRHDGVSRIMDCCWRDSRGVLMLAGISLSHLLLWGLVRMGCHCPAWCLCCSSSIVWLVWMLGLSSIQTSFVPEVWWSWKVFDRAGAAGVSLHPRLGLSAVNIAPN